MTERVVLALKKSESKRKDSALAKTKAGFSPSVGEKKGTVMKILVLFVIGPFFGMGIFYMDIFGRGIFCRAIYGRGLIYQALYKQSSLGFDKSNPYGFIPVAQYFIHQTHCKGCTMK